MASAAISTFRPILNMYLSYRPNGVALALSCLCLERIGYIFANKVLEGEPVEVAKSLHNKKDNTSWQKLVARETLIALAKVGQMLALMRLNTLAQIDVLYPIGVFSAGRVIATSQHYLRTPKNKEKYGLDFQLAALLDITVRAFNILTTGALLRHHSQAAMVAGVVAMAALSIENMRQHWSLLNRLEHILHKVPRTENVVDLFLGPSVRAYFSKK